MSNPQSQFQLPDALSTRLDEVRRRVWSRKSLEGAAIAVCGVLLAFLLVFALDRIWDTPRVGRAAMLGVAAAGCLALAWYVYRWVWRKRRPRQLARMLRTPYPILGDQLLGALELIESPQEQTRSPELCAAAIQQVSQRVAKHDLQDAVPYARHRMWAGLAGGAILVAVATTLFSPPAAANAWARLLSPWSDTPRYTFAQIQQLDDQQIVAHGESFSLPVQLKDNSPRQPAAATLQLRDGTQLQATLENGTYQFKCPAVLADTPAKLHVGDFRQQLVLTPKLRPELTGVRAEVELPEYLQRPELVERDVRGGATSLVRGSRATLVAEASRALAEATVNGAPAKLQDVTVRGDTHDIDDDQRWKVQWVDQLGLAGAKPFQLNVHSRDDEAPTVVCEGLTRQMVVLDSETLKFQARAVDDFGVKHVGIEWQGLDLAMDTEPAAGERILGAGSPTSEHVELAGTFNAKSQGITPQPLLVRLFTNDFLPDRERVYSQPIRLFVLSPDDHAMWLTEQLSRWHRQSLEVRDRELQLYESNQAIRDLDVAELDNAATRKRIQRQAGAERANGRRLQRLAQAGESLVKQASRNPEFGVGHLEQWAEMLQTLKDISANRMPSVADLLADAAKAEQGQADAKPSESEVAQKSGPTAGQNRDAKPGKGGGKSPEGKPKPAVPQLVDRESSQQPTEPAEPGDEDAGEQKSGSPRLTLPVTTLAGKAGKPKACPAGNKMDEAVTEQQNLLNEFDKLADEMNKILANLEGSTLVKRLKAAARTEYKLAGRLGDSVGNAFGLDRPDEGKVETLFTSLQEQQLKTAQTVSHIMDDMQAYYQRRRMVKFKDVLADMTKQDVLGGLRDTSDALWKQSGLTMAQCEFWSDSLDRWAEDLVDPAKGGS